ncbi:MAG TPA: hypothetical protein VG389_08900 [Myxococcota bacterium]|jgi:hypothetical protein|nr:hypothetical protein [Myxococcota bacterium]
MRVRPTPLTFAAAAAAVALAAAPRAAAAQECATPALEWLFCDDFESAADVDGNLGLWDDQGLTPSNLVLTTDPLRVHGGAHALEITAHMGADTGGGPAKWFAGADTVYLRFWTQFEETYNYPHHFVTLLATRTDDMWSAFGMAGCRPAGDNFYTTGIEPWSNWGGNPPPGAWNFYTYSVDMTCDPGATCMNYADPAMICTDCAARGSPCDNGPECCWGNGYGPPVPAVSALGAWVCVEAMASANTPGADDGAQAFWIDGTPMGAWSDVTWRTDPTLQWNALALWHYVTDDNYRPGQTQETVWFDDVVVSTAPIGCGAGGPPPGPDAGAGGATDAGGSGGDGGGPGGGGGGGRGGCHCALAGARGAGAGGAADCLLLGLGAAGALRALRRRGRHHALAQDSARSPR